MKTYFHTEEGLVKAVDGIQLAVAEGETSGVVGESGSDKSVTAYSILRLIPEAHVALQEGSKEPHTCLNPVFKCGWQVAEAIAWSSTPTSCRGG